VITNRNFVEFSTTPTHCFGLFLKGHCIKRGGVKKYKERRRRGRRRRGRRRRRSREKEGEGEVCV
jgi:hypothetical protein